MSSSVSFLEGGEKLSSATYQPYYKERTRTVTNDVYFGYGGEATASKNDGFILASKSISGRSEDSIINFSPLYHNSDSSADFDTYHNNPNEFYLTTNRPALIYFPDDWFFFRIWTKMDATPDTTSYYSPDTFLYIESVYLNVDGNSITWNNGSGSVYMDLKGSSGVEQWPPVVWRAINDWGSYISIPERAYRNIYTANTDSSSTGYDGIYTSVDTNTNHYIGSPSSGSKAESLARREFYYPPIKNSILPNPIYFREFVLMRVGFKVNVTLGHYMDTWASSGTGHIKELKTVFKTQVAVISTN